MSKCLARVASLGPKTRKPKIQHSKTKWIDQQTNLARSRALRAPVCACRHLSRQHSNHHTQPHPTQSRPPTNMSNWFDIVSLVLFLGLFSGAIYGAMVLRQQFSGAVESTKDGLKKRGLNITENGVSVKTEKRLDRDDYIGGTGRNIVDALKATSFGSPDCQRAVPDSIGQGYAAPGTRHRSSLSKK